MRMPTLLLSLSLFCAATPAAAQPNGFRVTTFSTLDRLPEWYAQDRTAAEVQLDALRGNPFVVIIFRGHGCYRCVKQLGKFAEVEGQFRNRGVRLIGLTNETVVQMNAALTATPLPFPILSDSATKLANSFGARHSESFHGILLVDAYGKLRWAATGLAPFTDYRAILTKIDELKLGRDALADHQIDLGR